MLSEIRNQNLFRATATLWVLLALTTFIDLASSAPQQLYGNGISRRASSAPGIGVEVEMEKIVIEGKKKLTEEEREKIKGAEIIPIGFAGGPKNNWKLTAELGDEVMTEGIVDGLKNKVGDLNTKGIGEEIFKFFQDWAPCRAKGCKATIKGFDNLGPWSVRWPNVPPADLTKDIFGSQVTTAMPLEAILRILSDTKTQTSNPLASPRTLYRPKIVILTKNDFKSFSKIKSNDINDEFLGFFSLLTSYCVLADFSSPKQGPKHLLPIMPRTDFVTQYTKFIEPKLKDQLSNNQMSLYNIVEKVSGAGSKLAKGTFKWKVKKIPKINEEWIGKEEDLKSGTLEVEKFLNYLQGYDKSRKQTITQMDLLKLMDKTMRYGQIGALGGKMEPILGTSKLVPIFEFRELAKVKGPDLGATFGSYEDKVIEYHKQFAKRSVDVQEDTDMLQEEQMQFSWELRTKGEEGNRKGGK